MSPIKSKALANWRCLIAAITVISLSLVSSASAAPIIHITEDQTQVNLARYLDVLEDPEGEFQAQDVVRPPLVHQFAPSSVNALQFGYTTSVYWLRFSIQNHFEEKQNLWLETDPPNLTEIVLYQAVDNGVLRLNTSGTQRPIAQRGIRQLSIVQAIDASPGTSTFYLKVRSDTPLNLNFSLHDPEQYVSYAVEKAGITSGAYSALIIVALTNLVLALLFREMIYFYYGGYLVALIGTIASTVGYVQNFFASAGPWQASLILYLFVSLANIAIIAFAGRLLNTHNLYRNAQRPINMLYILTLGVFLSLFVIPMRFHYQAMFISMVASSFCVMSAAVYCYYIDQNRHPLVIFLARLITLGFILTSAYTMDTAMTEQNWSQLWMLYIIDVEAIIISATLISQSIEMRQRHTAHRQVIAVAEAEARTQTEILNRISHDIRTPMSGVLGMSELLLDTPLNATQKDHVDTIRSSGQALLNLISEILDRSIVNTGKMEIEHLPFDLSILVNECIEGFRNQAEERNIELVSNIHSDVTPVVIGDATRLRQILLHLLGNAFKYTDQGDIVLTVSNHREKSIEHVLFVVKDNGRGISQSEQRSIFQPTMDDSDGQRFRFGLGLAISKQLIAKMNGDIGVKSELGKGSEFWFSVPLPAQPLSLSKNDDIESALRNRRMLVVDDNQTCRKVLQQQASAWGVQVATANNGNEALAKIRAKSNVDEPFDIVIVDHDMPGMNGLQLATKVVEEFPLAELPLMVMLTGLNKAPSLSSARKAGITRVLTKPVSGKALKTTLAEELEFISMRRNRGKDGNASLENDNGESPIYKQKENLKILIAEDNTISQKVIVSILRKLGIEGKTVNNGKLALETLQRERFDLVLMDCEMPIMDGFEATREIRKWENESERQSTPIIALTAHIMDEHKEQSLASGMNAHLAKPVEINQLEATIRRWTQG